MSKEDMRQNSGSSEITESEMEVLAPAEAENVDAAETELVAADAAEPDSDVRIIDLYKDDAKIKEEEAAEEVLHNKKKHRKTVIRITALVTAVAVASCGIFYVVRKRMNSGNNDGQMPTPGLPGGMDASNLNVITASGTTSIGMVLDTLDLDTTDLDLKIEKVYVSGRDEVEQGDPILKVSDDSIESARTTLEQTYKSAQYAYDLNQLQESLDRISAQETYDQSLVTQKYAQQNYDNTVATAQAKVDDLQKQVDDQQELVDEYTAAVADENYYRDYYKVDELYAELEKNFDLQMRLYSDKSNGIADIVSFRSSQKSGTATTTNAAQGMPSGGMPSGQNSSASTGDSSSAATGTSTSGTGTGTGTGTDTGTGTGTGTTGTDTGTGTSTGAGTDTGTTGTDTTGTTTGTTTDTTTTVTTESTAPDPSAEIMISSELTASVVSEDIAASGAPTNEVIQQGTSGTAGTLPASGTSGSSSGSDITLTDRVSTSSSSGTSGTSSTASAAAGGTSSSVSNTGSSLTLNSSDLTQSPLYAGYVMLDGEVTEETKEYEEALENAEEAQANASALLKQAASKLKSLQLQLRSANTDLTTETEEAQETLNTANAEAAAAQETYETSIRSIENTASTLEDARDTAKENLDAFEEAIGDGYFYTSTPGTIMMVGVEEGETLTSDMMIAAYTDTSSMTVTASVEQGSIASINVGDTCYVYVEDAGVYEGTVSSINPETMSSSRTSVYYTAIITLDGDVSDLSENVSATVYFGDDADQVMNYYQQNGQTVHSQEKPAASDGSDSTAASGTAGIDAVFAESDTKAADTAAAPPAGGSADMPAPADETQEGGTANE